MTLLSFHYQDFSIQLRNSLNSSWLLRLLIPTAGCSQSVYKLIAQASAQSSGIPALTASQISAIEAIQAALSMISLGVDSVPGTLMLFCLGYSLVRAVKYTVLARWELVERSKVYTKDCTTVRAKESRRIKDESKKAVSEEFLQNKNEKNTKFTTITYKGRVIELPEDIEKTADLSALPAGAVSSYKPGKNKEKERGQDGFC